MTRGFPENVNLPIQIGEVIIKISVTALKWGVLHLKGIKFIVEEILKIDTDLSLYIVHTFKIYLCFYLNFIDHCEWKCYLSNFSFELVYLFSMVLKILFGLILWAAGNGN